MLIYTFCNMSTVLETSRGIFQFDSDLQIVSILSVNRQVTHQSGSKRCNCVLCQTFWDIVVQLFWVSANKICVMKLTTWYLKKCILLGLIYFGWVKKLFLATFLRSDFSTELVLIDRIICVCSARNIGSLHAASSVNRIRNLVWIYIYRPKHCCSKHFSRKFIILLCYRLCWYGRSIPCLQFWRHLVEFLLRNLGKLLGFRNPKSQNKHDRMFSDDKLHWFQNDCSFILQRKALCIFQTTSSCSLKWHVGLGHLFVEIGFQGISP